MPFAETTKTYSETRKRTSAEYVRFTPAHRVTLRILNPNAKSSWKHWIAEANAGRGMMATCPNTSASDNNCPIDATLKGLPRENEERRERSAKRRYMVNVLDRTPYTVCDACDSPTPGKECVSCGASLKSNKFAPLNRVKILEGGPRLFTETLNGVDKLQSEEFELAITDYDITFQTQGTGRERKISAIPGKAEAIGEADLLDVETGEPQKLFDLDLLAEPTPVEEIELMLKGATMDDLNSIRGIA
jgi:hypothetical protein